MSVMSEQAVVIEALGGPEQLKLVDVSVGEPGPGEIRIDRRYALADVAQAHLDLEVRRLTGSAVLLP